MKTIHDWPGGTRALFRWVPADGEDPPYQEYIGGHPNDCNDGELVAVYRLVGLKRIKRMPERWKLAPVSRARRRNT